MQEMHMVHWFILCRKVKSDCGRTEFLENRAKHKPVMSNGPSIVIVQTISNTYKQIWRISEVEQINTFGKKKNHSNWPKASNETLIDVVTRNSSLKPSFFGNETSLPILLKPYILEAHLILKTQYYFLLVIFFFLS